MDLNQFETKLNTDKYTKNDIRKLLNYAFKLKAKLERLELDIEQNTLEKNNKDMKIIEGKVELRLTIEIIDKLEEV